MSIVFYVFKLGDRPSQEVQNLQLYDYDQRQRHGKIEGN
jgi:hypothetical protein